MSFALVESKCDLVVPYVTEQGLLYIKIVFGGNSYDSPIYGVHENQWVILP